jgi:nucleoside phosphorylase
MLKVLIVDDDIAKTNEISKCLQANPDLNINWIRTAAYLSEARQLLQKEYFDLLILDLNVPARPGDAPKPDGGVGFLYEVKQGARMNKPSHVIAITAYEDLLTRFGKDFNSELWFVIQYEVGAIDWKEKLASKCKYLVEHKKQQQSALFAAYDYDLAIVTAVANSELKALLTIGSGLEEGTLPNDSTIYHRGFWEKGSKSLKVVAAVTPQMGMQASTALCMKLIAGFRPRYIAMTGIAAGVNDSGNFGDLLIADHAYDYGSGKIRRTKTGETQFLPDPKPISLDNFLKERLITCAMKREFLDDISNKWQGTAPDTKLNAVLGPFASGAAVVQDTQLVQQLIDNNRKLIGIDMETYGIFYAAANAPEPKPKAFSIKSISDFADLDKDDRYHKYAAFTSASFVYNFALTYL